MPDDHERRINELEKGHAVMRADIIRIEAQQLTQHGENTRRLDKMDLTLNGDGTTHNRGIAGMISDILAYGRATTFWAKLVAALLAALLTYIGVREGMARLSNHSLNIFSRETPAQVYADNGTQDALQ